MAPHKSDISVLLVDPDPTSLRQLRQALEGEYRVVGDVGNLADGLRFVSELAPQIVVVCPDQMDAVPEELVSGFRRARRDAKLVVLTAEQDPGELQVLLQVGAWDILETPFEGSALRAILARACQVQHSVEVAQAPSSPGSQPKGALWLLASATTGDGRTTLGLSLAEQLALRGDDTLFLDADTTYGDAAFYLDVDLGRDDLADLLESEDFLQREVIQKHIREAPGGLRLLAARGNRCTYEESEDRRLADLIRRLRLLCDHLVVDLPPRVSPLLLALEADAEVMMTVSGPTAEKVKNHYLLRQTLAQLGYQPEQMVPVVTRVPPSQMKRYRSLAGLSGARVLPRDRAGLSASASASRPVTAAAPEGPFAVAVRQLVEELAGRLVRSRSPSSP